MARFETGKDFTAYATVGKEEDRPGYPHEWFDTSDGFPDVLAYLARAPE